MNTLVAVAIAPFGVGDELAPYVAEAIRVIRDGIVIYTGKLGSLKRFKDDVKEVVVGQDCGLNIESFNDIRVGDIVEGYEQVEVKRK